MRRSFRWIVRGVVMAALLVGPSRADAITLSEIMQLTKAGVGDDVLLALIEVDQRVFSIDPETIQTLKAAGVSQQVIVAIVKSGRTPQAEPPAVIENTPPPDPPQPQVVVVDRPVIHEVQVPVAVPVYVAVGTPGHGRHRDRANANYRPSIGLSPHPQISTVSPLVDRPEPRRRAEPVYWGWGGKLRPDAWQPTPKK